MFKNLNQLKNNVKVGQKVRIENYLKDKKEDRIVIKKQTNGLYTGIEISKKEYEEKRSNWLTENSVIEIDGKYYTKSFLDYQKASQMSFNDNVVEWLAFDKKERVSNIRVPSLDFKVNETWLKLIFQ